MEDLLEEEEMEEEKLNSDDDNETTKDSEPMEAEAAPPFRISGGRITSRYEDGQSLGVRPPPARQGIGKGNQGRREQHKSRSLESRKTGEPADPTSEYTDRMRGLLNTEILARMQQDTHMVEADIQAQATLIRMEVSEEEIMAINGRLDAIRVNLGKSQGHWALTCNVDDYKESDSGGGDESRCSCRRTYRIIY
ncbi:unnamed protein product [Lactuca saligna]|uniref:Uncharacterized protein n=1 Tax=Lactuca saligna TaxID=75948 RepID=A0AA35YPG6_LACSI|nr:unnamed protein product [Lactuca saligna]